MKIKNLSSQNLNLSFTKGNGEKTIITLKPNQVLYADNNSDINKQLLIYEKKKLLYVNREMDKPSYVDYYKPFFESGATTTVSSSFIDFDDEDDEEVDSIMNIEPISPNFDDSDDDFDGDEMPVKKGRGRPKGTVKKDIKISGEKKGRGRPKGTTKKESRPKENPKDLITTENKRGRGRPKGSVKTVVPDEISEQNNKRGRPKDTIKLKVMKVDSEPLKKHGRGRPKGSTNKNTNTKPTTELPVKRKRGRPRKFQFDN